jgi:hypothetical protein
VDCANHYYEECFLQGKKFGNHWGRGMEEWRWGICFKVKEQRVKDMKGGRKGK